MDDAGTQDLIRQAAREACYDWYVAALLAPRAARSDLITLAAFAGDLMRVPRSVNEPMMGAIRLQWWRDALDAPGSERIGHPLADAVRDLAARRGLAAGRLLGLVDSQELELQAAPPEDEAALDNHFGKVWGNFIALSAAILQQAAGNGRAAAPDRQTVFAAAAAYGRARLAGELATRQREAGQTLLPGGWSGGADERRALLAALAADAHKAQANFRQRADGIPRSQHPAFLPLALVEPYLRRSRDYDAASSHPAPAVTELSKTWRMLIAHVRGRI